MSHEILALKALLWIPATMGILVALLVLIHCLHMYRIYPPKPKEVLFDVSILMMPELLLSTYFLYIIFN